MESCCVWLVWSISFFFHFFLLRFHSPLMIYTMYVHTFMLKPNPKSPTYSSIRPSLSRIIKRLDPLADFPSILHNLMQLRPSIRGLAMVMTLSRIIHIRIYPPFKNALIILRFSCGLIRCSCKMNIFTNIVNIYSIRMSKYCFEDEKKKKKNLGPRIKEKPKQ